MLSRLWEHVRRLTVLLLLRLQFSFAPSSDKMVRLTSSTSVCSTYILILNSSLSKIKLLNKELVALREAGVKAAESLQSAEAVNAELEDRLQHRDWELRDLAAVKDARCGVSPYPCGWTWPMRPMFSVVWTPAWRHLPVLAFSRPALL